MTAYYNEIDPYAAQWLRNLIAAGHIAPGEVDTRSIEDVKPDDLKNYTQCHFFAGIGGWSHALRLAGWPDDRPIWTGSCPCQPFSAAGKGAGFADERHLWPAFFHLIRGCVPGIVFGEQVASTTAWLDLISSDLAAEGYAFGATVLGAHSIGAPHQRQRLYWVADSEREGRERPKHDDCVPCRAATAHTESMHGFSVVRDALATPASFVRPDDGLSVTMARRCIHGYGNAIVPQCAAEVIKAYMEQQREADAQR